MEFAKWCHLLISRKNLYIVVIDLASWVKSNYRATLDALILEQVF
jgi:hypothetical protein